MSAQSAPEGGDSLEEGRGQTADEHVRQADELQINDRRAAHDRWKSGGVSSALPLQLYSR